MPPLPARSGTYLLMFLLTSSRIPQVIVQADDLAMSQFWHRSVAAADFVVAMTTILPGLDKKCLYKCERI